MQPLTLTQLFGEGAFQDANVLVIQKANLLRLTPNANNTGESLLAAILITALINFRGVITDENNQPIAYNNSEAFELIKIIGWSPFFFKRNNQRYMNHQIIVETYTMHDSN
jgi:hypothetical protein